MSRIKKRKFFDEEAVCKDDSEDFSEEDDDDDNSLADFIDDGVEEDIPLPPKPRGRPTEKQKKRKIFLNLQVIPHIQSMIFH